MQLYYCSVTPLLNNKSKQKTKLNLKSFLDKVGHFDKRRNQAYKIPTFRGRKKSLLCILNIDLCHNSWTAIPGALIFFFQYSVFKRRRKKKKKAKRPLMQTMVTDHFYPRTESSKYFPQGRKQCMKFHITSRTEKTFHQRQFRNMKCI